MIRSANDLISEENPDYQYVAARLLLYSLRKQVWGESEPPRLLEHIKECIASGVYDADILNMYSESEIHKINKYIKHNRDENFTYAGLQQLVDKYLIKNRGTGEIYETPQFAYILIAMVLFSKYGENRLSYIKKAYDYFSKFKINLPTPIMCGVRTPIKQFASCILIHIGDSMESIFSAVTATGMYTARRAGIGLNIGRMRPIGSQIRNGEVIHTGVIPFLKVFESTARSCSQNGIRGGNATVSIPFFHPEIEDVIVLKNNAGTDDNRVRRMDYSVQFSKLFYERVIKDENITLFSPFECPELMDRFGRDDWDGLYVSREKDSTLKFRKTIKARQLAELFSRESLETGRIYLTNIDHAYNGSFNKEKVGDMSGNLCKEVIHCLSPLKSIDDPDAEIGVCILSAINVLETKLDEYEDVCDVVVRMLDELIDYQEYPVKAAENFCKKRRSIGVGITNLAAYLAHNKMFYWDNNAPNLVDEICEHLQFFLLKSSCKLAEEKGACEKYNETTYFDGILPIDRYVKAVDNVCSRKLTLDWEGLRQDIKKNGLRHSTLSCAQPCESSSLISNSTNGIEPVRNIVSYKKSKQGILKQIVPNLKYKNWYTKAFHMEGGNTGYFNIVAVIQKFFDMGTSTNRYYNYADFPEGKIPLSVLTKDMLYMYKMGIKSLYYTNTPDGDAEETCVSGACAI